MTIEEVQEIIRAQSKKVLTDTMNHGATVNQMLVKPQKVSLILRTMNDGEINDSILSAWIVGQENSPDGYTIVMTNDGSKFGLASRGFTHDEHLILSGWYGTLLDAFQAM